MYLALFSEVLVVFKANTVPSDKREGKNRRGSPRGGLAQGPGHKQVASVAEWSDGFLPPMGVPCYWLAGKMFMMYWEQERSW